MKRRAESVLSYGREHLHVLAYLVLAVMLLVAITRVELLARETRSSLCKFRLGLEQRASDLEAFLALHPNGIPGLSGNDLQRSLDQQRATLASLYDLEC